MICKVFNVVRSVSYELIASTVARKLSNPSFIRLEYAVILIKNTHKKTDFFFFF